MVEVGLLSQEPFWKGIILSPTFTNWHYQRPQTTMFYETSKGDLFVQYELGKISFLYLSDMFREISWGPVRRYGLQFCVCVVSPWFITKTVQTSWPKLSEKRRSHSAAHFSISAASFSGLGHQGFIATSLLWIHIQLSMTSPSLDCVHGLNFENIAWSHNMAPQKRQNHLIFHKTLLFGASHGLAL